MLGSALLWGSAPARAQPRKVALLPLDAAGKLELYGHPVAAEVARTLASPEVEIVLVGTDAAVPLDAVLLIEGELSTSRRRVMVELRLRTLESRTPLATVSATERSVASLDRAAVEAAHRLSPSLLAELARRAEVARAPEPIKAPARPVESAAAPPVAPATPLAPAILVASANDGVALADREQFLYDLVGAASRLTSARWRPTPIELPEVNRAAMLGAVATSPGALGVAFVAQKLEVSSGPAFLGKAQVRVIVTHQHRVLFDRVLLTDSVVGRRKADRSQLLGLLAREVVEILRPRLGSVLATDQTEKVATSHAGR